MLSTFDATQDNVIRTWQIMGNFKTSRRFYLFNSIIDFIFGYSIQGHLNDGYGVCIRHYTKFLINKLEFHDRNPRIPANLTMKRGELDAIGGGDINF